MPTPEMLAKLQEELIKPTNVELTKADIISDKGLRQYLDKGLQDLKALSPSRERALSITKLQECIMWLGMDLKRLNELLPQPAPSPYPSSYDPSTAKVEPTADGLKL